jgi:adenylate kinase family enzyme
MKNKLVLISGPQEAGKSTLAQALIDCWRFKRYAFATMVREELIAHGVVTRDVPVEL